MNVPNETCNVESQGHSLIKETIPLLLLVEHNREVATTLQQAFRTWGYQVWITENGQDGLDVIKTQPVDGILLDMHTPTMDGRTMLDELHWAGYEKPVWVMADESDIKMLRQLLDEGVHGFLIKPLSPKTIEKSCAELVYQLNRSKERANRVGTNSHTTMVHHLISS